MRKQKTVPVAMRIETISLLDSRKKTKARMVLYYYPGRQVKPVIKLDSPRLQNKLGLEKSVELDTVSIIGSQQKFLRESRKRLEDFIKGEIPLTEEPASIPVATEPETKQSARTFKPVTTPVKKDIVTEAEPATVKPAARAKVRKPEKQKSKRQPQSQKAVYVGKLLKAGAVSREKLNRQSGKMEPFEHYGITLHEESLDEPFEVCGVDLKRAIKESGARVDDRIEVTNLGVIPVRITNTVTGSDGPKEDSKVTSKVAYRIEVI